MKKQLLMCSDMLHAADEDMLMNSMNSSVSCEM